jgi:hypothetical protein
VKEVEGLGAREGAELVIVLRARERRGVIGVERWRFDRIGALNAPRPPDIVVRSMSARVKIRVCEKWCELKAE